MKYSFFEPLSVGSNLIVGGERDLLIDTGFGFGDIRQAVKKFSKKPLSLVNSHVHADHSLDNRQFKGVYIGSQDWSHIDGGFGNTSRRAWNMAKSRSFTMQIILKEKQNGSSK